MLYAALIADLVNSRRFSIGERERIQKLLKVCLEKLNRVFRQALQFDVVFSAGDEVQGLFISPQAAFLYARLLRLFLAPVQIRCGIGVGQWEVKIARGTSSEQDGAAYHRARSAIAAVKAGTVIDSAGEGDLYINALLGASSLLAAEQSYYQQQITLLSELVFPLCQKQMDLKAFGDLGELFAGKIASESAAQAKRLKRLELEPVALEAFDLAALENAAVALPIWKKGFSTKLAARAGTSRQNMDRLLRAAKIVELRNIDAVSWRFMAQRLGG